MKKSKKSKKHQKQNERYLKILVVVIASFELLNQFIELLKHLIEVGLFN